MKTSRRSTNRPGFRFSIRTLLFVSAISAVILAVIAFVSLTLSSVLSGVKDSYAVDWASEFVIQHLSANNNRWPTSWDDLRDEYDDAVKRGRTPAVTWEEMLDRVEIDWSADPNTVAEATVKHDRKFRVIWLSDGSRTPREELDEPNWKILDYLQSASEDDAIKRFRP